jgi:hypothetical protein
MLIRNRIIDHVRVRAGELAPHELNPRLHTEAQRRALALLYEEIGFARSLLAYRLADGRLKLIDGHLRKEMNPDMIVDVEVLDVNEAEARALLLAIDPLAQLAGYQAETLAELRSLVESDSAAVKSLWETLAEASQNTRRAVMPENSQPASTRFFVLIACADETEQLELLRRFQEEGLKCEAKIG